MKRVFIAVLSLVLLPACGGNTGGDDSAPVSRNTGSANTENTSTPARGDGGMGDLSLVFGRVGDNKITAEAVIARMVAKMGEERTNIASKNPEVLGTAVASLLDEFAWMEMCKKKGIDLTSRDRAELQLLEAELYTRRYMAEVINDLVTPSPDEVKADYNNNLDRYISDIRVGARHVLVGTQEQADRVVREYEAGAKFTDLVRKYSIDEVTKNISGNLGYIERGKDVTGVGHDPQFNRAILSKEEGEVAVLQTSAGWHVVLAERKDGGEPIPLEDVYSDIETMLANRRLGKIYNEQLEMAREETKATFIHRNIEAFTGISDSAGRLMEAAQSVQEPNARLEAYRRVAFDHPDSEYAPQALFRSAYTQLVELGDPIAAEKTIRRLEKKFSDSDWTKSAVVLKDYLDMENTEGLVSTLGTADELHERTTQ